MRRLACRRRGAGRPRARRSRRVPEPSSQTGAKQVAGLADVVARRAPRRSPWVALGLEHLAQLLVVGVALGHRLLEDRRVRRRRRRRRRRASSGPARPTSSASREIESSQTDWPSADSRWSGLSGIRMLLVSSVFCSYRSYPTRSRRQLGEDNGSHAPRDGHRQRHAGLVLRRRRRSSIRGPRSPTATGWSPRARRSSTSAVSRRARGAAPVPEDDGAAPRRARVRGPGRHRRAALDRHVQAAVAQAAIERGATLRQRRHRPCAQAPELAGLVAERGCELCLMHMLGDPRTMQQDPRYDDVVSDVRAFLEERLAFAVARGDARGARPARPRHRVRQDARAQPRAAARALDEIVAIGCRVVIGTSRK